MALNGSPSADANISLTSIGTADDDDDDDSHGIRNTFNNAVTAQ